MLKSVSLMALTLTGVVFGLYREAYGASSDGILDFSLPDQTPQADAAPALAGTLDTAVDSQANGLADEPKDPAAIAADMPLPVPARATNPPISRINATPPASVYRGNAQALSHTVDGLSAALPPAPPTLWHVPIAVAEAPEAPQSEAKPQEIIALSFEVDPSNPGAVQVADSAPANQEAEALEALAPVAFTQKMETFVFNGGRNSLVARAIGSAEGTRTPGGDYTRWFRGHVDPGNQAWNLGTFSYQHGASSPEEADHKQLARLQRQVKTIQQKAEARGMVLDLAQTLNALDLANQSPLAALGRNGYMTQLKKALDEGKTGDEAILWARTYAYFDFDKGRWNAPGLGNTLHGVNRDQQRRMNAVASAIQVTHDIPAAIAQYAVATPDSLNVSLEQSPELELSDPVDSAIALNFDLPSQQNSPASVETASVPEPSPVTENLVTENPDTEPLARLESPSQAAEAIAVSNPVNLRANLEPSNPLPVAPALPQTRILEPQPVRTSQTAQTEHQAAANQKVGTQAIAYPPSATQLASTSGNLSAPLFEPPGTPTLEMITSETRTSASTLTDPLGPIVQK
ncbi:MAG: hypothetical protein AAF728_14145 [Cyanobacteria bacterium P01_D01_bin.128]